MAAWPERVVAAARAMAAVLATIAFLSPAVALDKKASARPDSVRPAPKVLIVSMFAPEGQVWLDHLGPWRNLRVAGLSPDYPFVHCNRARVCVMTSGMGHSNAAASMTALLFSHVFDLSHTYVLIAGIAGINPEQGTVGSVAWAHYLVDFGVQWEIDGREIPPTWTGGYLGINSRSPGAKPPLDYRTEVFELDETLLRRAVELSQNVPLSDSVQAQVARSNFRFAPANQPPSVLQCDTLAGDTWFSGTRLAQRASEWMKLLTDGKGVYCTTQQEDNATYEALKRGAASKLVDLRRVAVLRAGSDFDRPYAGQSAADNLLGYAGQGGFAIALQNLYLAGHPFVNEVTTHWKAWRHGAQQR